MNINDFEKPSNHPYGMLRGYENANEKEAMLAWMLIKCIEAGDFCMIETKHDHPTMVEDGLLEKVADKNYRLTKKAIGLLYSQYAR